MEAYTAPSQSARAQESRSNNRRIPGNTLGIVMLMEEALGLERYKVFQDWGTSRNNQPPGLWRWLDQ